jgi:hypothetical protein
MKLGIKMSTGKGFRLLGELHLFVYAYSLYVPGGYNSGYKQYNFSQSTLLIFCKNTCMADVVGYNCYCNFLQ